MSVINRTPICRKYHTTRKVDYYALVDATGRSIVANKRGYIPDDLPENKKGNKE